MRSQFTNDAERLRQRRQVLEAEGYLSLIALPAQWATLEPCTRDRLAERALACLAEISEPANPPGHVEYLRGRAYCAMDRHHDAIEHFELAAQATPKHIKAAIGLARCHKRLGRIGLAVLTLRSISHSKECRDIIFYNLACYLSLAEQPDAALQCLADAIGLNPAYRQLMADDSDFDPIRSHPGFVSLQSVVV